MLLCSLLSKLHSNINQNYQKDMGKIPYLQTQVENMKSKMPQAIIIITILSIICLMTVFVSVKFLLRAGGLGPINSISATDLVYGYKISFPIHFDRGYQSGGVMTSFESDQSIDDIINKIQESHHFDQLSTKVCSETQAILTIKLEDDQQAIYFLRFESDKSLYVLFNMAAQFQQYPLPLDQQSQSSSVEVIFPYHLVQSSCFSESMYFYENTAYQTNHSINDFYDFYKGLGIYKIERAANEIYIKGYSSRKISDYAPNLNQTIIIRFNYQELTNKFMIIFDSD